MKQVRLIALLMLAGSVAGCTTTPPSRKLASEISDSMSKYAEMQRTSVESLNANYRATYATLMTQYANATSASLKLERKAQARAAADAMLIDWKTKTTFAAIVDGLDQSRSRQLAAIETRNAALQSARTQYASSYSDLRFELDKLKAANTKIADLSQTENVRKRTLEFLGLLAKAYRESRTASK